MSFTHCSSLSLVILDDRVSMFMRMNVAFATISGIVIKTGLEVDSVKEPGPGFHGLTRVNPEKLKNIYLKF